MDPVTLTVGSAPFGPQPAGVFNFPIADRKRTLYFEDSPRRVRGRFAGETVVDSGRVKLLHEYGHLPVYYFPEADVRMDLLEATEHRSRCPRKGEAVYWSVRVGDRVTENAVWSYPEPIAGAPPLEGYLAFYWNKIDQWFEEDEEVFVHPRDPYHRVDVLDSSRHVRVSVHGEVVAETRRAKLLFESGLPTRYYVPLEDVREQALSPSPRTTRCPYKGIASYHVVTAGGHEEDVLAWTYLEPIAEVAKIAGYLCFFNERVDLDVDGERQPRPGGRWATADWAPH